jgi:hypothetical protein
MINGPYWYCFYHGPVGQPPTPRILGFSTLRSVGLLLVLCGVVCDIIPDVKRSVTSTVIYLLFVMHPISLYPCTQLVAPLDLAFMDAADQRPPKGRGTIGP